MRRGGERQTESGRWREERERDRKRGKREITVILPYSQFLALRAT